MGKDIKISNLKGLLIFLVIFGHLIELYKHEYYEFFVFIYAFHMPLFIFISGYLAKRINVGKIINLIMLYLIFQTFFNWVLYMTGDYQHLQFTYGIPHFHLWYIVSLIFWYVIAWMISKVNLGSKGKWIIFSLILFICFISRWYTDDLVNNVRSFYPNFSSYTLSYQRTISFMPFFFAGFFINKDYLNRVYSFISNKKAQLTLILVSAFLTFLYVQSVDGIESIFRGSFGTYRYMEDSEGFSVYILKILTHYLISGWLCILIINCVSDKRRILTKWGDHSLTMFLFHPVFVFTIRKMEFFDAWETDVKVLFFFIMALVISFILGSNIFVKVTQYICLPSRTLRKIYYFFVQKYN